MEKHIICIDINLPLWQECTFSQSYVFTGHDFVSKGNGGLQ